jgi:predicted MFS family arabinose efflux permease
MRRVMAFAASLAPLRLPGFARLVTAYTVNELGDSVAQVALAVLVFDRTGSALASAALFVAMRFVPALIAPALSARLDLRPLRAVLPALYVTEGLAFAALALTAHAFLLPFVLAVTALDGTLALTGRSLTRAAAAATLEPAGALREGNALLNVGFAVSAVLGAALGGALVAGFGVATALAVDAVSFFAIAALLRGAHGLRAGGPSAEARAPWRERLRAGLAYARRHPLVWRLLLAEAAAMVFFYLVIPVEVVYVKRTLGAGDGALGALLAAWGGGILLGSLLFARLRARSLSLLLLASTAAIGLAYLGLAVAPTLLVACAVSVLGGIGNGIQWIAVVTSLQEAVHEDYQARVMALLESGASATPGLGFLLGGAITAAASPRAAYALAGVGVLLILAAVAAAGVRDARRSARSAPMPAPVGEPA